MEIGKYFTEDENNLMKEIAKLSVLEFLAKKSDKQIVNIPEKFNKRLACFVTIYKNGELRGCIGTIEPVDTLYNSIKENAISSASKDHRFEPIKLKEFSELSFEVSVLSEPELFKPSSVENLLNEIKGKGVIIKKNFRQAVYLPQVWEHFQDEKKFLASLCQKAGLFREEWVDFKSMKFYVFSNLN